MIIDISTAIGKTRLRCGDVGDLEILPDSVYTATLAEVNNSVPKASVICATYILGTFSQKSHRKIGALESWDNAKFEQYKQYLMMIAKDPAFNGINPIPYSPTSNIQSPIVEFLTDWTGNFVQPTHSKDMHTYTHTKKV